MEVTTKSGKSLLKKPFVLILCVLLALSVYLNIRHLTQLTRLRRLVMESAQGYLDKDVLIAQAKMKVKKDTDPPLRPLQTAQREMRHRQLLEMDSSLGRAYRHLHSSWRDMERACGRRFFE